MAWPRKRVYWVVGSVLASALLTLAAVNLIPAQKRIEHHVERLYQTGSDDYYRSLGVLLGPPVLGGNRVEGLQNGREMFPAMLAAIRSARRTINLEAYIFWSDHIGRRFVDALCERARSGVRVHVLIDWVGSKYMESSVIDEMTSAGVEVHQYHALKWYDLARVNNRTHRKILVVDGRIGFTGGGDIADKWDGDAQDADHWRDSFYRVEGPVVAQMQAAVLDNWTKATGKALHGPDYLPPLEVAGESRAQMLTSSPDGGAESLKLMYLLALTAATRTIDIANAYFVPDALTTEALVAAMRRGVRLRIVVPGPITDTNLVRRASRSTWGPLLEAGAEIYEYQPTMLHSKVLIVDGLLVSVGSANFDPRSYSLNDEANLNVYDAAFAMAQETVFERDIEVSKRITRADWENRPWYEKSMEHAAGLLQAQL